MQIQTQCQCGAKFAFSPEQVSQTFRCSVCHQVFQVPSPGQKPVMKSVEAPAPQKFRQPRRSRSRGMGCVVAALLMFLMFVAGGAALVFLLSASTGMISQTIREVDGINVAGSIHQLANPDDFISKYIEQGYQKVSELDAEVTSIDKDTLYTLQVLDLKSDVVANLALLSQTATLHGDINGNVDFCGQTLTIKEDAVIHGDLNLEFAQLVIIEGQVEGKLTGEYHSLEGADNVKGGLESSFSLFERIKDDAGRTESALNVEWSPEGLLETRSVETVDVAEEESQD